MFTLAVCLFFVIMGVVFFACLPYIVQHWLVPQHLCDAPDIARITTCCPAPTGAAYGTFLQNHPACRAP